MATSNLNRSGIYRITCQENGKIYIGSAANIRKRWKLHRGHLRMGIHHNNPLQSSWKKYGEDAFKFDVLEFCSAEEMIDTEQKWLDSTKAFVRGIGFNVLSKAYSSIGLKHSDETKAKLKAIAAARSPDYYKKIGDIQRGRPGMKGVSGHVWTDAEKLAASLSRKGRPAWNKGIPHTEEAKARISAGTRFTRRTIPQEKRDEIKALRLQGLGFQKISDKVGVSLSQCHKIFNNIEGRHYKSIKK